MIDLGPFAAFLTRLGSFRFQFTGSNIWYEWWHFEHPGCPMFNQRFAMVQRSGCELCGFTPCESKRIKET
jgi:hypothetical protein